MKQTTISRTTGKEYCPEDCARILSIKQVIFYMQKGIDPVDFYPSKDYKTGEDVMVFMINKQESREAYIEWLNLGAIKAAEKLARESETRS